jgi:hypothetical protein
MAPINCSVPVFLVERKTYLRELPMTSLVIAA